MTKLERLKMLLKIAEEKKKDNNCCGWEAGYAAGVKKAIDIMEED